MDKKEAMMACVAPCMGKGKGKGDRLQINGSSSALGNIHVDDQGMTCF